jgi:flavin reductase (DIM6/NTAB) family NADH-FMN oxidoreductase RutF
MDFKYYDLESSQSVRIERWIQPPQISYFVTTIDMNKNVNSTPVTMGTCVGPLRHFVFSLSNLGKPDFHRKEREDLKHAYLNLEEVPECVISYIGHDLLRESWIAGLPLPRGISEIEVAGLTPLPSKKVKPPGIAECPINLEAKVVSSHIMPPYHTLYLCDIVGVFVREDYVRRNQKEWNGMGVFAIDPLFEVLIDRGESGNRRLVYARLDPDSVERTPEDIGCLGDVWIGRFEKWIADEMSRGKITEQEREEIISLRKRWEENRDPEENGAVKTELTKRLKEIVAKDGARRHLKG